MTILFPTFQAFIDKVVAEKQEEITTESMSQLMSGIDNQMAPFAEMAERFRKKDFEVGEEELKEGDQLKLIEKQFADKRKLKKEKMGDKKSKKKAPVGAPPK